MVIQLNKMLTLARHCASTAFSRLIAFLSLIKKNQDFCP